MFFALHGTVLMRLIINLAVKMSDMSENKQGSKGDSKMVLLALAGGISAFAIALIFVSGGLVRQTEILLPEKTYVTLAFQNNDGELQLVGIEGIAQINPTVLMRIGDFVMELTVVNQDKVPHSLYIDGLDASTGILEPGQSRVLTLSSNVVASYNYYIDGDLEPMGQVKAVKVGIYE
jgi:hypothetical protein